MQDWTEGYVADIGYTYGYYNELNPLRHRLAFLNNGLVLPEIHTACELGFGQGLSVNIHAAASNVEWWGTDFNPAQAGFAQELNTAGGAQAQLFDQAFAEFCQRPDLPDFDYIGMHGIWTWISDENRAIIVDFVKRKLKIGGVFYISYNTQPGWAGAIPLRHLLFEHAELMSATGQGTVARVDAALDFAEQLFATQPRYLQANPAIAERFKALKGQNRHYLAHEYFNRDWQPMMVSDMARWLGTAKVEYACSAHYLDHIDTFNLTEEQRNFLQTIPNPLFKETVRDYLVNQQFRRDYWVKGARKLSSLEQRELLAKQRVVLSQVRTEIPLTTKVVLGDLTMNAEVYHPILDTLADYQIKTLAQIETAIQGKGITFAQLWQAVLVLANNGALCFAQEGNQITKAKSKTDKLNLHLLHKARTGKDVQYLASPVSGGGISLTRFQQLFLLARLQGKKQPEEWANFAWQVLAMQGEKIIKEGNVLETAEQNIAELSEQAATFSAKQLPVLKGLGII